MHVHLQYVCDDSTRSLSPTACVFTCDNSKCIVVESDLCNAVDDCDDYSDEIRNCGNRSVML